MTRRDECRGDEEEINSSLLALLLPCQSVSLQLASLASFLRSSYPPSSHRVIL
jgi:hypothetical protein